MCYLLPGAQARYYPNYVKIFEGVVRAVFENLYINTEGVDPIIHNFVCGVLKWEAE